MKSSTDPLLNKMKESEHNNNQNEIKGANNIETVHQCTPGERGLHIVRTQKRQLFCQTHSLYSTCTSIPCPEGHICTLPNETFVKKIVEKKELGLSNFSRTQVIVLLSLVLSHFLSFSSMSIMAPFFPKEARNKGMGIFLAGCVFSFYALIVFLTAPLFGKVLPKLGAKPLFIGGMLLSGLSNVCFGFLANVTDYVVFTVGSFVIRGLEALGASAFSTSSFVFVVELYPDNVSTVLGVLETFIGIGLSAGPALGGILYSIGGFGLPFYVLGGIIIAAVPLSVFILPSTKGTRNDDDEGSFWKLVKIPSVFIISLVIVLSSNVWSFLDPTLEPHLEHLSLSSKEVGFVFLLFSAVYAIFSLVCGWLADKYDNHWSMMVIGLVISTGSLIVLGPSPFLTTQPSTLGVVLLSLSFLSASIALTLMPTFQALLKCALRSGQKKEIATYSLVAGTWASMYSLGDVIGPMLGGILLDNYGFPILSTVMAFITLAMAGVALIFFMCRDTCTNYNKKIEDESKKPLLEEDKCIYYGGNSTDCVITFKGPTSSSAMYDVVNYANHQ